MSHPDQEALVDLALGDDDLAARHGDHVRGCAACTAFVAEIRHARDLVAGSDEVADWDQPPADVWTRIERAVDVDAAPAGSGTTPARHTARSATKRSRAPWWVAAASVAGIVVGLAFGWAFWSDPVRSSTTIARTALDTLDTRQPRGEAALVGTGAALDLRVDTTSLDAGKGYLEVWLINRDGKRMVSVGVLSAGTETFPVSQALIDQGYVVVDISREGYDDKPQHSGDSLARGQLPA